MVGAGYLSCPAAPVKSCTSNIDFVNSLVRAGALTGRQTLGAEHRAEIDTCIAEADSRPMQ